MDGALPTSKMPTAPADARSASPLHRYSKASMGLLLAADVVAFFASFYLAMGLVDHAWQLKNFEALVAGSAWLSIGLWILIFARLGMYSTSAAITARDEVYYTIAALAIGIVPELLFFTLVPELNSSRLLVIVAVVCAIIGVGGSRAIVRPAAKAAEHRSAHRALLVTFADDSGARDDGIVPKHWHIFRYRSESRAAAQGNEGEAVLERLAWFRTAVKNHCDTVVVGALLQPPAARHVATLAERHGLRVAFAPSELRRTTYEFRVEREARQMMLEPVRLSIQSPAADFCKSLFDRFCAALAIVALSPILAVTAIAIRLDSPGPVLFRQERVGRYGRGFRMCKFRSMFVGAGADWVMPNDRRVTRVGAFIRRFSIDELPQLFNVLAGEMSLVGPRPEMREYAERFRVRLQRYDDRHLARPGITGWTQINMRRHLTPDDVERVLENDLFYIENWSFLLDLSILFKTAMEFLFHRGV